MWHNVRAELAHLHWEAAPPLSPDLHDEWTQTADLLQAVRRRLGPVPADDPIGMLVSATLGAHRANTGKPVPAPSLAGVRQALAQVPGHAASSSGDARPRQVATLTLVAYELVHWVRVRTTDRQARAWLQAGETALDHALHSRGPRSGLGAGLAAWQDALAAIVPVRRADIVQRSLALGHLTILRTTHALVQDAQRSGALDVTYAGALLTGIRDLGRFHQSTLSRLAGQDLGNTRTNQAVMLKLGSAVRDLATPADGTEPAHVRLHALLSSGLGQTVLVAQLIGDLKAHTIADRINRNVLDYLGRPRLLSLVKTSDPPQQPAPVAEPQEVVRSPSTMVPAQPVAPTVQPGTRLTGEQILALCHARDLGVAAATSNPTKPPDILHGVDPKRWPQLVHEGQQAVADLVTAVSTMVYAQSRGAFNGDELRSQMFLELMGAARRFDPHRTYPEAWPSHAWLTLTYARRHGVDTAGVVNPRTRRPDSVPLDGWEPASQEPDPTTGIEQQETLQTIQGALDSLPERLREPLVESIKGQPPRAIAEALGVSPSTISRRIRAAREQLRGELSTPTSDRAHVPFETATSPSQRSSRRIEERRLPTPITPFCAGPNR